MEMKNPLLIGFRFLSGKGLGRLLPDQFKVIMARLALLTYPEIIEARLFNGRYCKFSRRNSGYSHLVLRGLFERNTAKLMNQISGNFDLFCDVGSNFGYFALIANSKKIIAIEPEDYNYSILQENIRKNNLDIQALKMAISNKKGTEKLFISEEHSAHSLKIQNVLGDVIDTVEVFVNTLDNTLSDYMDQSMLIKIDVEGLEPKVFEGMKKILEKSNIAIIFEYTPYRYTEQEREFIQEIIARDFRIFNLHDKLKNPVLIDHNKFRNIEYQTNLFLIKNSFAKFENEDPGKPITPGEGKS